LSGWKSQLKREEEREEVEGKKRRGGNSSPLVLKRGEKRRGGKELRFGIKEKGEREKRARTLASGRLLAFSRQPEGGGKKKKRKGGGGEKGPEREKGVFSVRKRF